jgi:RNA polymerase sigma-70 factor (ECF subfamily)
VAISDADLIARVLVADDRHAFGELVRRYQSPVRSLLRRLTGESALADDLAQETFLRAFRGLRGYRGGSRFSSWLFGIAYRAFLTENSYPAQRDRAGRGVDQLEPTTASTAELSDLRHDLRRALVTLGPDEQAALSLAYGIGATHEEVSEILGWPLGTVKTRILRAKEKLRQQLGAWEEAGASS